MSGDPPTWQVPHVAPPDEAAHDHAVATVCSWARRRTAAGDRVSSAQVREVCWHLGLDRDTAVARVRARRIAARHGPDSALARLADRVLAGAVAAYAERKAAWAAVAAKHPAARGKWYR